MNDFSQQIFFAPIAHFETISMDQANRALVEWGHKMGPCHRPMGMMLAHGLFEAGNLVAVTVASDLVAETCAGFSREKAVELARLCAIRPDLCRVALRLWREFVFPQLCAAKGWEWAVSYQDEDLHDGNTYRFDGWVVLATNCRSGTDQRSGRKGRVKTIWGWHPDKQRRASVRKAGAVI